MPKFDATINGISLASYGVEPNMATVPQPEAKTYQAEIPGRDGLLDYTDAYGVVRYENRTVTVEAYEIGDITARMEHRRAICSDMHGKTCTLSLTTLPGYTFTGRCSVEYDEDGAETAYKLSFDCQPYMSAGERTFYANCAGGVDLVFMSGDKPVKPRIEVPRRSIIVFNGQQYEVEAGTWTFDGILFKRGRNDVYINTYTEPGTTTWGDLESMTWEQIGWHHRQSDASGALVNVTDALQARPNKLVVDGKAVQAVTTGKNLFCTPTNLGTLYGATATANIDSSITISGTPTKNVFFRADVSIPPGTYTISNNAPLPKGLYLRLRDADERIIAELGSTGVTTVTTTREAVISELTVSYLFAGGNVTIYPQLELGSIATSYEPYTGCEPSPSPDYPQEVDVVDSPVSVQATGKNLNKLPYESTNNVSNGITWTLNNDGSVTANGTDTNFINFYFHWSDSVPLPGARIVGSGCPAGGSTNSYCIMLFNGVDTSQRVYDTGEGIAIPDGWESVRFFARIYNGTTVSNLTFKPQIEVGTSPTPYEPYTSNQQTITLPPDHNYLASLPDGTRDELVLRSDGVAVLTERVGKRVFNGSEAWSLLSGVSYGFRLRDTTLSGDYRQLICDRYTVREFAATSETQGVTADPQKEPNLFCFRDTTIAQTVEAWKAKLAASNVMVYYALATATVRYSADNGTTWSTIDPAAGNSAIQLYKGTNNVWCTDALSPNVTLNYDTQERTRKRRISELYWLGNEPKKRLTWGQLATHTWKEIGSKSIQEWYFSGTAEVVENAYINYEIGEL